jgi:fumarate reductase subunit D
MSLWAGDNIKGWTNAPLVKLAEAGLVFLLLVHMLRGVPLLLIENFEWRNDQKELATLAAALSVAIAFVFLALAL